MLLYPTQLAPPEQARRLTGLRMPGTTWLSDLLVDATRG